MLIRECAPLCLTLDSGWGRVSRGWAWIAAANTMLPRAGGVKAFGGAKSASRCTPGSFRIGASFPQSGAIRERSAERWNRRSVTLDFGHARLEPSRGHGPSASTLSILCDITQPLSRWPPLQLSPLLSMHRRPCVLLRVAARLQKSRSRSLTALRARPPSHR